MHEMAMKAKVQNQHSTMVPNSQPAGCVIFINGFPGIGKLSIARSLQGQLADMATRLFDNHLIIYLAEAIHP